VIRALRSLGSGWGASYLRQLAGGRFRFPTPTAAAGPIHFIVAVANHFEPTWKGRSHRDGLRLLRQWCEEFSRIGVKDVEGHRFKHTYFFPGEQYHRDFLEPLVEHCGAGFGEVEVHLHHGVDEPDTAENLERALSEFTARLVEHGCLGRHRDTGRFGYCFVHGDWELANSASGEACGVDNEMEILARTGCYLDCTLPSAPDPSQVSVINSIYQCGRPLSERAPHRTAAPLAVGQAEIILPVLLQGPLLLDWSRRRLGLPVPRIENGSLSAEAAPGPGRFRLWGSARVHVLGRPEWVFIKLHTHGLIERHMPTLLGDPTKRFLEDLIRAYGDGERHQVHFATAREAANMILAAVDGQTGSPGRFRDYRYATPRAR
jgi:hypothetical protein